MNMTLSALLPGTALPSHLAAVAVPGIAMDTRRLNAGDLFMAVPGEQVDGRAFIPDAIRAGACAVLTESSQQVVNEQGGVPVIGVPALREQAGEIAGRFFGQPSRQLHCVGVTGTNGKSSCTWFLRDALQALGHPCALVGTLGMSFDGTRLDTGHTTPDVITLQSGLARFREQGASDVAMEVSSHALVQHRLSGVDINIAVFTNLSREHLDYHGDMDAYFAAKARLFQLPSVGHAVINVADPAGVALLDVLDEQVMVTRFNSEAADVFCLAARTDTRGMSLDLRVADQTITVQLPLYGRFNVDNVQAVAAVLHAMGYGADEMAPALAAMTPVPGRMQRVVRGDDSGPTVLVDYAHTPDALEKALQAVRQHFNGRVHVVIGCGGNRDAGKRPQMAAVAADQADQCIFTADNPRNESPQAIIDEMMAGVRDVDAVVQEVQRPVAIHRAIHAAAPADVVLIAGKGHEGWQEIAGERVPMDDVQLAGQALDSYVGGAA